MYKKIIFILLTILFMSGSCNLDKTASKPIDAKTNNTPANTLPPSIPTLTDTTPINLVDTRSGAVKFDDLIFEFLYRSKNGGHLITNDIIGVSSVLISTTDAALKAAGITKLSEAKSMRDQDKLKELIASLTFTIRSINTSSGDEFTMKGDYKNFKIIYDGLRKTANDPSLKPKLNIDGRDVEFKDGYEFLSVSTFYHINSDYLTFPKNKKPAIIAFLGDILGINGIESFKKYIP